MTPAALAPIGSEWVFLAVALLFTIALAAFFTIVLRRAVRDEPGERDERDERGGGDA